MEKTCLIIKPDGVGKKAVGKIINRLSFEGLKLCGLKMLKPKKEDIEKFYEIHKGKPFFEPLINFMLSGPIVVSVWQGDYAVSLVRKLIGSTNSKEAAKGTLRKQFGTDNRRNLVHASDSSLNAVKEITFFFDENEVFEYNDQAWINK